MNPASFSTILMTPLAGILWSVLSLLAGGFLLGLIVVVLARRLFRD